MIPIPAHSASAERAVSASIPFCVMCETNVKFTDPPTAISIVVPNSSSQNARVRIASRTVQSGSFASAALDSPSVRLALRCSPSGRRPTSSGRRRMISGGSHPTTMINSAISRNASRNPPSHSPAEITSGKIIIPLRVPIIVRPIAEPRRWMNQLATTTTTAISITATVIPRPTPQSKRNCQSWSMNPNATIAPATSPTETNNSIRGP